MAFPENSNKINKYHISASKKKKNFSKDFKYFRTFSSMYPFENLKGFNFSNLWTTDDYRLGKQPEKKPKFRHENFEKHFNIWYSLSKWVGTLYCSDIIILKLKKKKKMSKIPIL